MRFGRLTTAARCAASTQERQIYLVDRRRLSATPCHLNIALKALDIPAMLVAIVVLVGQHRCLGSAELGEECDACGTFSKRIQSNFSVTSERGSKRLQWTSEKLQ